MANIAPPPLLSFLLDGRYADLLIQCQKVEFKVHRVVVCAQSSVIDNAVTQAGQNGQIPRIDLSGEKPEILSQVILFLYSNHYDHSGLPEYFANQTNCDRWPFSSIFDHLKTDIEVYQCANNLKIEPLKTFAADRFLDEVPKRCDDTNFANTLEFMYQTTASEDKKLRLATTKLFLISPEIKFIDPDVQEVVREFKARVSQAFPSFLDDIRAEVKGKLIGEAVKNAIKDTILFVNTQGYCMVENHDRISLMRPNSFFVIGEDGTTISPECSICYGTRESESSLVGLGGLSLSESS